MSDLERFLAFDRRASAQLATRIEPFEHGRARFNDELPSSYALNALEVDPGTEATAAELAAAADRLQGAAGLLHRKVAVDDDLGARLAPDFRRLGWEATELLVMVRRGRADFVINEHKVEEVAALELEELWAATIREDLPGIDEATVAELVTARRLRIRPYRARCFAARAADGRLAAHCELYDGGDLAQVEDVGTLAAYRGRGLGTAVVTRALAESPHASTFVVADAGDWPKEWYARLGFAPLGSIWDFLRTPAPLRAIRLRTPRLELRLAGDEELLALAELARRGVHPPGTMPFRVPWTEGAEAPGWLDAFRGYHRGLLAAWSPDDWHFEPVAFLDGEPAGCQGLFARRFAGARTGATGSWLALPVQGRGLGTEMRAALLELLFRGLDGAAAESGAFVDNPASIRVSEKLGYARAGERAEPRRELRFRLERRAWRSPVPVELEGVGPALPYFGAGASA